MGNVLVELKAHSGLGDADFAQALHYMRSSRLRKGLLINFGLRSLQHRRLVLDNDIRENPCQSEAARTGAGLATMVTSRDPPSAH